MQSSGVMRIAGLPSPKSLRVRDGGRERGSNHCLQEELGGAHQVEREALRSCAATWLARPTALPVRLLIKGRARTISSHACTHKVDRQ